MENPAVRGVLQTKPCEWNSLGIIDIAQLLYSLDVAGVLSVLVQYVHDAGTMYTQDALAFSETSLRVPLKFL